MYWEIFWLKLCKSTMAYFIFILINVFKKLTHRHARHAKQNTQICKCTQIDEQVMQCKEHKHPNADRNETTNPKKRS